MAEPVIAGTRPDAAEACTRGRPMWLLAAPQPLESQRGRPRHGGALRLLKGPERIESGWWDGGDIRRDYYVAKDVTGAVLWIYRECDGARHWFLHGIFG